MEFSFRNQSGFVSVSTLALIPLLASVLAVLGASYLLFRSDGQARHICRLELLGAEAKIAVQLKNLLALNPSAEILRASRKSAELAERAAIGTPAFPAAQARLLQVIGEQMTLRKEQQLLISKARLISRSAPQLALGKVRQAVDGNQILYGGEEASSIQGNTVAGKFDVIAEPLDSPTPNYRPSANFRDRQEMRVAWRFDLAPFLPQWIRTYVPLLNLTARADCSSTLEREGTGWQAKITMGKP